jgi:excisionase family DNA binding protein
MHGRIYERTNPEKPNRAETSPRPGPPPEPMACWRVERVARYLDVTKKRVYHLVQQGRLEAVRLGPRQMRILRQSVEDYVATLLEAEEDESN